MIVADKFVTEGVIAHPAAVLVCRLAPMQRPVALLPQCDLWDDPKTDVPVEPIDRSGPVVAVGTAGLTTLPPSWARRPPLKQ